MPKLWTFIAAALRGVTVISLALLLHDVSAAQSLPGQVLSPVIGPLRVTSRNIGTRDDKWEFNQHKTDFHRKGGGVAGSNDTYAWDANWYKSTDKNADVGQKVFAVAGGEVVKYGGVTFGASCNAVLVAHPNKQNPIWYSGYIHLGSIKVGLDERVTSNTVIGTVGRACAGNDHLHFAVYKGSNTRGGLVSFDVKIIERTTQSTAPQIPLPSLLTGSLVWNFNRNTEGWSVKNASAFTVQNGILFIDPSGRDPYISSPRINLSAFQFKWIVIRMASNGLNNHGAIYFKTDWQDRYTESKRIDFAVRNWTTSGNARFANNLIYMGLHPNWRGRITGIRIDPTDRGKARTNRDTIGFDYIKITSNP